MANALDGFYALSDPTRREIFERITRRPSAVSELAEGLPVTRPAVSQHLKVLRDAQLVSVTQEGTRRVYALDLQGVSAMRAYLDRFWDRNLDAFKAAAEKETDA